MSPTRSTCGQVAPAASKTPCEPGSSTGSCAGCRAQWMPSADAACPTWTEAPQPEYHMWYTPLESTTDGAATAVPSHPEPRRRTGSGRLLQVTPSGELA